MVCNDVDDDDDDDIVVAAFGIGAVLLVGVLLEDSPPLLFFGSVGVELALELPNHDLSANDFSIVISCA